MTAARRSIGDRAELLVDANGAYTRKQAVRVLDAVADLAVVWYEEPVTSDDLEGLRVVRDQVHADVTAGEYGYDLVYFQRMAPFVDCLQVDVTRCGGISEFLRVAAVAAAHGLEVSTHTAPHQHLAVAAATQNLRHVEWFHDHVRIEQKFLEGTGTGEGGKLTVNLQGPGNGLAFRRSDAESYRVG